MPPDTKEMFVHRPSEETRQILASQALGQRRTIHEVNRRPFGLDPDALLASSSAGALLLAMVLFAIGEWIGGLILLALGVGCVALLGRAVRHAPSTRIARLSLRFLTAATGFARLVLRTTTTWASAVVALVGISLRRHRRRRQLHDRLTPLGEAVYRDDRRRAEQLKAQAAALEQALREADRQAAAVVESARDEVRQERATAQPTQSLPSLRA